MMPRAKRGVSFDQVCALGLQLPGVERNTSYGTPALKVKGASFARLREDGETLVLKVDMMSRDHMLRAQPDRFFITDHFRDWPWVLLRLSRVTEAEMRVLLENAWELVAPRRLVAERTAATHRAK
jgi:hypothetical protein